MRRVIITDMDWSQHTTISHHYNTSFTTQLLIHLSVGTTVGWKKDGTRITEDSEYNNIHNPYVHNASHQYRYKEEIQNTQRHKWQRVAA